MLAVIVGVMLAGFFGVMHRVDLMPARDVRVMAGLVMIPTFMMVGCCAVMASGVFVVLRGLAMMLGGFSGHGRTSDAV
jgi:hypothetical protein